MDATCCQIPLPSRAGYFLSRSKVKITSAGVKALPSLHFTPCRIVKTTVFGFVNL